MSVQLPARPCPVLGSALALERSAEELRGAPHLREETRVVRFSGSLPKRAILVQDGATGRRQHHTMRRDIDHGQMLAPCS
jgi:hypothetical protein